MLDHIQSTREKFADRADTNKGSNAFIGLIFKHKVNGELQYYELGSGPCHGALSQSSLRSYCSGIIKDYEPEYILSSVQRLLVPQADAEMFIEWLVQRSPYQEAFITKDVKDILKYGYVCRTDLPNTFVAGALIASRFITENYNDWIVERFKVFKKFIEAGISETEAFLFAHSFGLKTKAGGKWEMEVSNLSSGHAAIDLGNRGLTYAKNFLTANIADKRLTFKERCGYESGIFSVWGGTEVKNISSICRVLKPRSKLEAKNYNIFEKKPTAGYLINNLDDLRDIGEQLKEHIYA